MGGTIETLAEATFGGERLSLEKRAWEDPERKYSVRWRMVDRGDLGPKVVVDSPYAEEACRVFLQEVHDATQDLLGHETMLPPTWRD